MDEKEKNNVLNKQLEKDIQVIVKNYEKVLKDNKKEKFTEREIRFSRNSFGMGITTGLKIAIELREKGINLEEVI